MAFSHNSSFKPTANGCLIVTRIAGLLLTPALKKCPGVGNRQENSTHENIFKKSIRGGKLYSLFEKKEKKKKDMP